MRMLNPQLETPAAYFLIVFSTLFLFVMGIMGVFKPVEFGFEFHVFYNAGSFFLQGVDPWDALKDTTPFSYPPHVLPLLGLYSILPFSVSLWIHTITALVSIAAICYLANYWFLHIKSYRSISLSQGFCLAIIIGNPFMVHNLFMGQLTLPLATALLFSWHFLQRKSYLLSGLCLTFATIKPQLSILFIFWLCLTGNFRVVLIGGGFSFLLLIPGFLQYGVLELFTSWIDSIVSYSGNWANKTGSLTVVSLENLLGSLGVPGASALLKLLAFVLIGVLFKFREKITPLDLMNTIVAISILLIYGHDYDFAATILLWSYLTYLTWQQGSWKGFIAIMGLMFIFFFPQRLIRDLDMPLILHARSLVLVACVIMLYVWKQKYPSALVPSSSPSSIA